MRYVRPSRVSGQIDAPPSKSLMQRAVIAAALAEGPSVMRNPSLCDDAKATLKVVQALGARVESSPTEVWIRGGGTPTGGILDCGESGTCMRMIAAVAALRDMEFTLTGRGSLLGRPVGMMEEPLRALGARCQTANGLPPIMIKGPIHEGKITVDGSETSQVLSGLLMALPLCTGDSEVDARNLQSGGYAAMTISLVQRFGISIESDAQRFRIRGNQLYRPTEYEVDGDWSGAAFMLVAGAIAGEVEVRKLRKNGLQPDEAIVDALRQAGAGVEVGGDSVRVRSGKLRAIEFDATGSPDLFPPLVALACNCEGTSTIRGATRLKHKETDRAATLADEFGMLGASIRVDGDRMEIMGRQLRGGKMDSKGDHRMVMGGAIAALTSKHGVEIEGDGYVAKSHPAFFDDLRLLTEGRRA